MGLDGAGITNIQFSKGLDKVFMEGYLLDYA